MVQLTNNYEKVVIYLGNELDLLANRFLLLPQSVPIFYDVVLNWIVEAIRVRGHYSISSLGPRIEAQIKKYADVDSSIIDEIIAIALVITANLIQQVGQYNLWLDNNILPYAFGGTFHNDSIILLRDNFSAMID